jgi:hypothetical protein
MHDKITELIEKATKRYPATESSGEFSTFDKEKFAELIVRECSLFVFKQNGPKSALNLLEHFGVEE